MPQPPKLVLVREEGLRRSCDMLLLVRDAEKRNPVPHATAQPLARHGLAGAIRPLDHILHVRPHNRGALLNDSKVRARHILDAAVRRIGGLHRHLALGIKGGFALLVRGRVRVRVSGQLS
eukprot:scaffold48448_cov36-Phaeocystis_antarctica.AAC.3